MNIIFDYDGTLHDTSYIYCRGFRKAYKYLIDKKLIEAEEISDYQITKWLGLTPEEMWTTFLPQLTIIERNKCISIVGKEMEQLVKLGKSQLYDGVLETLTFLNGKGHVLIFLSNCTHAYMEFHREHFQLDKYFSYFYCGEDFGYAEKTEIFKTIYKEHPGEYAVVGDRYKDIEIGLIHGIKTIGCLYGYGSPQELYSADIQISTIKDLMV